MSDGKEPTQGEIFEGFAFQFCKVATVCLLCGKFALPISAGICSIFFLAAFLKGKRDTRCFLRDPRLASFVFGIVCLGSWWFVLRR